MAVRAKTPLETAKTLTEVTKSVRKPTKKARQGSRGPSDHLGTPEQQGPCDYQGPKRMLHPALQMTISNFHNFCFLKFNFFEENVIFLSTAYIFGKFSKNQKSLTRPRDIT